MADVDKLRDALRREADLGNTPRGEVPSAWRGAAPAERRAALDERLFETLLAETLTGAPTPETLVPAARESTPGGFRPGRRGVRWARAVVSGLALGATVAVCLAWALWPTPEPAAQGRLYPAPQLAGNLTVTRPGQGPGTAKLTRGALLTAGSEAAAVTLGDYCRLALAPGARCVWTGQPRAEAINLETGKVRAQVTSGVGAFQVRTPLGTVKVIGTEFVTEVAQGQNGNGASGTTSAGPRKPLVTVMVVSGKVGYEFGKQTGVLAAGETRSFSAEPAGGTLEGTVVSTNDEQLKLNVKGEPVTLTPALTKNEKTGKYERSTVVVYGLKSVLPGELIKVEWREGEHGRKVLTRISYTGTVTGRVAEKGKEGALILETELGRMRFLPYWRDGAGGEHRPGPTPSMVERVQKLEVGAKVKVGFTFDEHRRLDRIEVVK